jgi:hypothetical protein
MQYTDNTDSTIKQSFGAHFSHKKFQYVISVH